MEKPKTTSWNPEKTMLYIRDTMKTKKNMMKITRMIYMTTMLNITIYLELNELKERKKIIHV